MERRELCKALLSSNLSWRPTVLAGAAVMSFFVAFLPFFFVLAAFLGLAAFLDLVDFLGFAVCVLLGVVTGVLVFTISLALTIFICLPCLVEVIVVIIPKDFATCAIST